MGSGRCGGGAPRPLARYRCVGHSSHPARHERRRIGGGGCLGDRSISRHVPDTIPPPTARRARRGAGVETSRHPGRRPCAGRGSSHTPAASGHSCGRHVHQPRRRNRHGQCRVFGGVVGKVPKTGKYGAGVAYSRKGAKCGRRCHCRGRPDAADGSASHSQVARLSLMPDSGRSFVPRGQMWSSTLTSEHMARVTIPT